jgi:2-dehydropantoate 2-reductase
MKIAIIGAGGVGGFYGAQLLRVGVDVSFVARGAHLAAIRANGLRVIGPLGDVTVKPKAESDPAAIGPVDLVIVTIKTYDNATALPLIKPLMGPKTVALTIQNGVDSAGEVAAVVGEAATIAGPTYIAAGIESPGVIRQVGTHRRIVFGEVFGIPPAGAPAISPRVQAIADVLSKGDMQIEPVADARIPIWEKFIYLAPFAAFTGASRLPIGPIWSDEECRTRFLEAVGEVERVARGSGIAISKDVHAKVAGYTAGIPPTTRSSLLIDLSQGKKIEVESLLGSVVRRGRLANVPTPMMAALYAVLKPHAHGAPPA